MTVLTIGLILLLLVRHRKNLARIWQGTEPKVSLRKKREKPAGRITSSWLFTLATGVVLVIFAGALWRKVVSKDVLEVGRYSFVEVARVGTVYQRAERVAFADGGNILAVTCPRYERLMLYRVTSENELELIRDIALDGKPVAICASEQRIYALMRPSGDRRHVEPGWWETFDFQGERVSKKVTVGFYPDDLALDSGGHALVLTSGRAEGGAERGEPALTVYELGETARPVGHVEFDGSVDNPVRLTLSESGRCAVVALAGSKMAASIDLGDPSNPHLIGRSAMPEGGCPYPSHAGDDAILMPVASETEAVALPLSGFGECVAMTLPKGSGIGLLQIKGGISLGHLTLRAGAWNLGSTRPTGIAYSRDRGLFAVANRSGGVHLVAVRVGDEAIAARY